MSAMEETHKGKQSGYGEETHDIDREDGYRACAQG